MFTGIIEKTGIIISFLKDEKGALIKVKSENFFLKTKLGDSIAINGICLTAVEVEKDFFSTQISNETLLSIDEDALREGKTVNLEQAMKLSDRLNGHIVSGHIDTALVLKDIINDGFSKKLIFDINKKYSKYIIPKGSIAINGVSLTINNVKNNEFSVNIIPHSFKNTNFSTIKKGNKMNIEFDYLAKYVEKNLLLNDNYTNITQDLLVENGFL